MTSLFPRWQRWFDNEILTFGKLDVNIVTKRTMGYTVYVVSLKAERQQSLTRKQ